MDWLTALSSDIDAAAAGLGWPGEGVLRLVLAAVAGGVIGVEREARVRHAGFRTMLLVSVGSAAVMLVSIRFAWYAWPNVTAEGMQLSVDPGRIAYGIMGGIGFLGAGTIIQSKGRARGLTTAAGIWCVAALGLAFGLGQYVLGTAATLIVLGALWGLNYSKAWLPSTRGRVVTIRTRYSPEAAEDLIHWLGKREVTVKDVSFARVAERPELADFEMLLTYHAHGHKLQIEREIETEEGYSVRASREV